MIWLLLLIGSGTANKLMPQVDLIELNHFYCDTGQPAYDQVIYYRWSPDYRRFDVAGWVLSPDLETKPRRVANHYEANGITAKLFRETWSQVDPERENKKLLPEHLRVPVTRTQP